MLPDPFSRPHKIKRGKAVWLARLRHAPRRPYSGSARQLELHTELSEIAHGHFGIGVY